MAIALPLNQPLNEAITGHMYVCICYYACILYMFSHIKYTCILVNSSHTHNYVCLRRWWCYGFYLCLPSVYIACTPTGRKMPWIPVQYLINKMICIPLSHPLPLLWHHTPLHPCNIPPSLLHFFLLPPFPPSSSPSSSSVIPPSSAHLLSLDKTWVKKLILMTWSLLAFQRQSYLNFQSL